MRAKRGREVERVMVVPRGGVQAAEEGALYVLPEVVDVDDVRELFLRAVSELLEKECLPQLAAHPVVTLKPTRCLKGDVETLLL